MSGENKGVEPAAPERLQGVPWFAACTEEQLLEMARIAERLRIQAGEVIVREGRLGRELFVILEGTATVTRDGHVVNILHAGDYFGELAAIEAVPRSATVHATTDLDVLIVGPREFESMMEVPGFRNALLSGMSRRIREADDRLAAYERGGPHAGLTRRGRRDALTATSAGLGGPPRQPVQSHGQRGLFRAAQEHGHPLLVTVGRRRRNIRASSTSAAATKGGEPMRRARSRAASWWTWASARSPMAPARSPR